MRFRPTHPRLQVFGRSERGCTSGVDFASPEFVPARGTTKQTLISRRRRRLTKHALNSLSFRIGARRRRGQLSPKIFAPRGAAFWQNRRPSAAVIATKPCTCYVITQHVPLANTARDFMSAAPEYLIDSSPSSGHRFFPISSENVPRFVRCPPDWNHLISSIHCATTKPSPVVSHSSKITSRAKTPWTSYAALVWNKQATAKKFGIVPRSLGSNSPSINYHNFATILQKELKSHVTIPERERESFFALNFWQKSCNPFLSLYPPSQQPLWWDPIFCYPEYIWVLFVSHFTAAKTGLWELEAKTIKVFLHTHSWLSYA